MAPKNYCPHFPIPCGVYSVWTSRRPWYCYQASRSTLLWTQSLLETKLLITLAPITAAWMMLPAACTISASCQIGGHDGTWTRVTPLPVHYYRLIFGLEHCVPNNRFPRLPGLSKCTHWPFKQDWVLPQPLLVLRCVALYATCPLFWWETCDSTSSPDTT